jgi:SAM-dependent methyltransferase
MAIVMETGRAAADDPRGGGLLPCERAILGATVRKGMRILELAITTTATVDALSTKALAHTGGSYRGFVPDADVLRRLREAHPELDLEEGDGIDLSMVPSGAFDAVVVSRAGLSHLEPDDLRVACQQEIHRVLRAGGVAVLSMRNPQAVIDPPSGWRSRSLPARIGLFLGSAGEMVRATGDAWRDGRLRSPHLYLEGDDPKAPPTYQARPQAFIAEIEALGFRQLGPVVASDHPHPFERFVSPWYYVAARKI